MARAASSENSFGTGQQVDKILLAHFCCEKRHSGKSEEQTLQTIRNEQDKKGENMPKNSKYQRSHVLFNAKRYVERYIKRYMHTIHGEENNSRKT